MNARTLSATPSRPLSSLSDDDLAAQLRAGSRGALGELYRRHAAALRAFVARRDPFADADDVVQSVFLVALDGPRFTPAPGRTLAWLRGVAIRVAAKQRAARREEIVTDADAMISDRPVGDEDEPFAP